MKCGRGPSTIRLPGSRPDLLLFKYFPQAPGTVQAWDSPSTFPRKRAGRVFSTSYCLKQKLAIVSTPESIPIGQSSTFMWAVHKNQTRNILPATWAQASKAKLSGVASSVHSEGNREGKGICPPAPRLSSVPPCQSRAAPARTGRQTGLPSDCMPRPAHSQDSSLYLLPGMANFFISPLSHRQGRAALPPPTIIRNLSCHYPTFPRLSPQP